MTEYEKHGWIKLSKQKPPYGEFVEAYFRKEDRFTDVCLEHVTLIKHPDGTEEFTTACMSESEWSSEGFKIKYWRKLRPLPNGKKPHLIVNKHDYFVIIYKKQKEVKGDG